MQNHELIEAEVRCLRDRAHRRRIELKARIAQIENDDHVAETVHFGHWPAG
jgi:hypothetical protein